MVELRNGVDRNEVADCSCLCETWEKGMVIFACLQVKGIVFELVVDVNRMKRSNWILNIFETCGRSYHLPPQAAVEVDFALHEQ